MARARADTAFLRSRTAEQAASGDRDAGALSARMGAGLKGEAAGGKHLA